MLSSQIMKKEEKMTQLDKRQKFATQVDAELLSQIKSLAKSEGFQIQAVVEEAFRLFLESKNGKNRAIMSCGPTGRAMANMRRFTKSWLSDDRLSDAGRYSGDA
jgi:hypothetical protein